MTYCVGLLLDKGLVMASDSRTNAGVDYISSYSKLHVLQPAPDRIFTILAAGSLSTTQEMLNRIQRDLDLTLNPNQNSLYQPPSQTLLNVNYMFEAANYIGQLSLFIQNEHSAVSRMSGASMEATFILGGQIAGQPHELFMVYSQGNFIQATDETPYFQIGESKYGKSVLDTIASPKMSLNDGARICLASMVATMRANLTVAPPFEVVIYSSNALMLQQRLKLEADSTELQNMHHAWESAMRLAFRSLPPFAWEQSDDGGGAA
ncbi:MAG TPA: 20S proteasome subunit A/B [bacterium]|nr:20S proteasome subunit A/B [bacterium]